MNRTMKKILNTIFLATFLFAAACSDGYDDTRIKKDLDDVGQILDELEQAVDGLRTQMDALTQLINSSFVSLISTDAEGNYVITYIDRGGESRSGNIRWLVFIAIFKIKVHIRRSGTSRNNQR